MFSAQTHGQGKEGWNPTTTEQDTELYFKSGASKVEVDGIIKDELVGPFRVEDGPTASF